MTVDYSSQSPPERKNESIIMTVSCSRKTGDAFCVCFWISAASTGQESRNIMYLVEQTEQPVKRRGLPCIFARIIIERVREQYIETGKWI